MLLITSQKAGINTRKNIERVYNMYVELVENNLADAYLIENVLTFIPHYQSNQFILDTEIGTRYFSMYNYTVETISSETGIEIFYIDNDLNIQKIVSKYVINIQEYYIVLINDTETIIENVIMMKEVIDNVN